MCLPFISFRLDRNLAADELNGGAAPPARPPSYGLPCPLSLRLRCRLKAALGHHREVSPPW